MESHGGEAEYIDRVCQSTGTLMVPWSGFLRFLCNAIMQTAHEHYALWLSMSRKRKTASDPPVVVSKRAKKKWMQDFCYISLVMSYRCIRCVVHFVPSVFSCSIILATVYLFRVCYFLYPVHSNNCAAPARLCQPYTIVTPHSACPHSGPCPPCMHTHTPAHEANWRVTRTTARVRDCAMRRVMGVKAAHQHDPMDDDNIPQAPPEPPPPFFNPSIPLQRRQTELGKELTRLEGQAQVATKKSTTPRWHWWVSTEPQRANRITKQLTTNNAAHIQLAHEGTMVHQQPHTIAHR